jgi:hypothetical protein
VICEKKLSGFLFFAAARVVFTATAATAGCDQAEYTEEDKTVGNEEIIIEAPHS